MDANDSKPGDHKVELSCPLTKKPDSPALPISLREDSSWESVPTGLHAPAGKASRKESCYEVGAPGNPGGMSEVTGGALHRDVEGRALKNFLTDGRLLPD